MRCFYFLIAVVVLSACVGNPPSGSSSYSARPARVKAVGAASLDAKVARLTAEIERKYGNQSYDEDDVVRWAQSIQEYFLEYTLSTSSLSDDQCESIEYNFGKIAGLVCNIISDPLEEVYEELEQYEERSEKWEDAAERGFESVIKSYFDE